MYKLKNIINRLEKFVKFLTHWLKRNIILILAAFMIGISNGMYDENNTMTKYQPKIEQPEKDKMD
jgi:cell division protein FtsL